MGIGNWNWLSARCLLGPMPAEGTHQCHHSSLERQRLVGARLSKRHWFDHTTIWFDGTTI
jgi:hypothetical protein